MPLIVCIANGTGAPFTVMPLTAPNPLPAGGTIAWSPFAPAPTPIVNDRTLPLHAIDWKVEALRPSSQSSICLALTTGMLRFFAEFTIATDEIELFDGLKSVCMLAVNAP